MIKLQPSEFAIWAAYVKSITGIVMDSSKAYLIENRLAVLAEKLGCQTFTDLHQKSRADSSRTIEREVINLITTGETLFFRDGSPFELLQFKLIPELVDRKRALFPGKPVTIRIWSAACSTGQEVYTIAMTLRETLGDLSGYDILILGTDISDQAIARASRGTYQGIEIERGLSKERLERHFDRSGEAWTISPALRSIVTFQRLNLLEDFSRLGAFDIIFCRNVAIYFGDSERQSLFSRMGKMLSSGGSLIVGSTELISLICPEYDSKMHMRAVYYRLKGST